MRVTKSDMTSVPGVSDSQCGQEGLCGRTRPVMTGFVCNSRHHAGLLLAPTTWAAGWLLAVAAPGEPWCISFGCRRSVYGVCGCHSRARAVLCCAMLPPVHNPVPLSVRAVTSRPPRPPRYRSTQLQPTHHCGRLPLSPSLPSLPPLLFPSSYTQHVVVVLFLTVCRWSSCALPTPHYMHYSPLIVCTIHPPLRAVSTPHCVHYPPPRRALPTPHRVHYPPPHRVHYPPLIVCTAGGGVAPGCCSTGV